MEIPDLIRQRLGDESLESAVSLGDEDLICFTPTRTLLYRGEGLIGDESVDVFDSNVERLNVSEGRRKTSFSLLYVDGEESFSVSRDRGDAVLQRLLQSILRTADVLDPEEAVEDVYLFSELTIVITDVRLVKHVGAYVWDADYEEYPFGNVTGLDFEEGSVATQIVLSVAGRPQRFKAPSDEAKLLRRSLTNALCEYHDVGSFSQLKQVLEEKAPEPAEESETGAVSSDIELDDSISPLVGDDDEEEPALDTDAVRGIGESAEESDDSEPDTDRGTERVQAAADAEAGTAAETAAETSDGESDRSADDAADASGVEDAANTSGTADAGVDPEEFDAMQTQLSNLTTAVKQQNKLLKEQHETIRKLIEELQRQE